MTKPTLSETAARMAQNFERMNEPRRANPVAVVMLCAAIVAVLATVLALLT